MKVLAGAVKGLAWLARLSEKVLAGLAVKRLVGLKVLAGLSVIVKGWLPEGWVIAAGR